MSDYRKQIEQCDTGLVFASVYRKSDGIRVGFKAFGLFPSSQERCLVRAHKWAEKWARNCQRYEVVPARQPATQEQAE